MLYTGSYKNCKSGSVISISGDRGKKVIYTGESYLKLAPKKEFWQEWHNNIGKISEEENTRFYIKNYIEKVLLKLDINKVYNELNGNILVCYEDSEKFCHRHLVAYWFELLLNVDVYEIGIDEIGRVNYFDRPENLKELFKEELSKFYNIDSLKNNIKMLKR